MKFFESILAHLDRYLRKLAQGRRRPGMHTGRKSRKIQRQEIIKMRIRGAKNLHLEENSH